MVPYTLARAGDSFFESRVPRSLDIHPRARATLNECRNFSESGIRESAYIRACAHHSRPAYRQARTRTCGSLADWPCPSGDEGK
jgi:hypothetical protein